MPFVPHRTQVDCGAGRLAARNDPGVCNYVLLAGLFLVIYGVIVPLAGAQLPSPSAASTQVAPQQNVDQSESPATPAFGERINPADERNSSESAVAITAPSGLPSEQIIDILQGNPDVVADLKSMAADRMRGQGTQIDPNDISDQMLFSQIAASPSLRANITPEQMEAWILLSPA